MTNDNEMKNCILIKGLTAPETSALIISFVPCLKDVSED